jgi:microcystin-dependent protein
LLGFGTWTAFAAGRVMVGLDGANAAFDTLEETGGSANATLPVHSHNYSGTTSGQSADHTHQYYAGNGTGEPGYPTYESDGNNELNKSITTSGTSNNHTHTFSGATDAQGGSPTNANLQPYIVVYMWKRTV